MARSSTLDEIGDGKAPLGTKKWAIAQADSIRLEYGRTQSTIEVIHWQLKSLKDSGGWQRLTTRDGNRFLSWEQFVESDWLRIPNHIADAIIRERDSSKTIGEVITKSQKLAADEDFKPAPPPMSKQEAGAKGGRGNKADSNRSSFGTTATYLVGRLKRDAPEFAQALARGEYKSARAAAIAAGIQKVPTPYELAVKAIKKLDKKDVAKLLRWLQTGNQET